MAQVIRFTDDGRDRHTADTRQARAADPRPPDGLSSAERLERLRRLEPKTAKVMDHWIELAYRTATSRHQR